MIADIITVPLKAKIWNNSITPTIGKNVKLQNAILDCSDFIIIEDDVFFGLEVMILTGSHDYNQRGIYRQTAIKTAPIIIKKGAWIGSRAIILQGVTIGENAVIGAGSVVTKNVDEDCLYAGNPATFIKHV